MMKRSCILIALITLAAVTIGALEETGPVELRALLRETFRDEVREGWLDEFEREALGLLTRERITLRTMLMLREVFAESPMPGDPEEAARFYVSVALRAEIAARRGESPARTMSTARTAVKTTAGTGSSPGGEPQGPPADKPGAARSDRAREAAESARDAKEERGKEPGAQGPK